MIKGEDDDDDDDEEEEEDDNDDDDHDHDHERTTKRENPEQFQGKPMDRHVCRLL